MTNRKNSKLFLVLFLGTLSAFGPFVTDLYLPALPFMGEYFGASTSTVQLTLTGSMVGLALGQLLIGPISDKKTTINQPYCLSNQHSCHYFFT